MDLSLSALVMDDMLSVIAVGICIYVYVALIWFIIKNEDEDDEGKWR